MCGKLEVARGGAPCGLKAMKGKIASRTVPLHPEAARAIEGWLEVSWARTSRRPPLWSPSGRGKPWIAFKPTVSYRPPIRPMN